MAASGQATVSLNLGKLAKSGEENGRRAIEEVIGREELRGVTLLGMGEEGARMAIAITANERWGGRDRNTNFGRGR